MPTAICRHIKTNGTRCGSPSLAASVFCYFHNGLRRRHATPQPDTEPAILHSTLDDGHGQRNPLIAEYFRPVHPPLELPPLEDPESIQIAISLVVRALAANQIEPKRAASLLYALQVASTNAKRLNLSPTHSNVVRTTVLDPATAEHIAPDEDPQSLIDLQNFINSGYSDDDCDCEDGETCEYCED